MTNWLFVYGTLRPGSGHPMSHWLAARACLLGGAGIQGRLLRVSYYPGLVAGEGRVRGDVVELDTAGRETTLAGLDAFEGCYGREGDEYRRERCALTLDDGRHGEAWVYWYCGPTEGLEYVVTGDWLTAASASQG